MLIVEIRPLLFTYVGNNPVNFIDPLGLFLVNDMSSPSDDPIINIDPATGKSNSSPTTHCISCPIVITPVGDLVDRTRQAINDFNELITKDIPEGIMDNSGKIPPLGEPHIDTLTTAFGTMDAIGDFLLGIPDFIESLPESTEPIFCVPGTNECFPPKPDPDRNFCP